MQGPIMNSENFNRSYENSTFEGSKYSSKFTTDSRSQILINQYNQLNQINQTSPLPIYKAPSKFQQNFSSFKEESDDEFNLEKLKMNTKITYTPTYKSLNTNSSLNSISNNISSVIDTLSQNSQSMQNSQIFNQLDKGSNLANANLSSNSINKPMDNSYINNRNPLLNFNENERTNYFPRQTVGQYGLNKSSLFSDDPFKASLFPSFKNSSPCLQNSIGEYGHNVPNTCEMDSTPSMNSNQKFFNSTNDGSLYSIFKTIQKDSIFDLNKHAYNYFYFKLFDNYGEDLNKINSYDYQNKSKQELFKEDEEEKKKYEILNQIDDEGQDSDSDGKPSEECFGPQKAKPQMKERNFKPY